MHFSLDVQMRDAPAMLHSINKKGVILNVSQQWADYLGFAPYEMIGRKSVSFLSPESRRRAETQYLPDFWEQKRLQHVHYDFVKADGTLAPVTLSAVAITDAEGQLRSLAWMKEREHVASRSIAAADISSILARLKEKPDMPVTQFVSELEKVVRDLT